MSKTFLWAWHYEQVVKKADQNPAFLESMYCQCLKQAKFFLTSRPLITCPFSLEWSFFDAFFTLTSRYPSCLKFCFLRQALLTSSPKSNQHKIQLLSFLSVSFYLKTLSQFICSIVFLLSPALDCLLPEVTDYVEFIYCFIYHIQDLAGSQ